MSPPSSRPPDGVPNSSGNAKYAIVAVVLLLGAGGLFAWRSMSSKDTPPPPPPVPSVSPSASTATTNPLLDDIPPPPPADTTPEAGKASPTYVAPAGGGCDSKCSMAYASNDLTSALQVRAAQARRCYNQALAQDSTLRGHVSIAVRISGSGSVCSANVASNDMGTPTVAQCAANVFRSGNYPAPHGGCVDANVPLSFVPMGQ